jgi:hypothetical protein
MRDAFNQAWAYPSVPPGFRVGLTFKLPLMERADWQGAQESEKMQG